MDRPLEIAFHNLDSSPSLEAEIRESVDRLEARYPQLIGCRVSVEAQHQQHRTGNLYEVHVVLSVRGGRDLAVSREPHKAKQRYANPDVRASMRDAFRAAEKQLQAHKDQLREDTTPPSGSALTGQVTQLPPGADHGFILNNTGTQLYFHRDSLTNADFAALKEGDPVHYDEEEGDGGPVATKVRLAAGQQA
jgi:cold shock CspA family protein/ribosome-associated translation inhibitor RaiA